MPAGEGGVSKFAGLPAIILVHSGALSLYVRLSQDFGTGTMQMFIDLGISSAPRAQQLLLQQPQPQPDDARARHNVSLHSLPKGS